MIVYCTILYVQYIGSGGLNFGLQSYSTVPYQVQYYIVEFITQFSQIWWFIFSVEVSLLTTVWLIIGWWWWCRLRVQTER